MRADLTIYKAATALAAYQGRDAVTLDDVNEVSELALSHRRSSLPKAPPPPPPVLDDSPPDRRTLPQNRPFYAEGGKSPDAAKAAGESTVRDRDTAGNVTSPRDEDSPSPAPSSDFAINPRWKVPNARKWGKAPGVRGRLAASDRTGAFMGSTTPRERITDLALVATLRAAAPWQIRRGRATSNDRLVLKKRDLREKLRLRPTRHLILFCVDASRSMGASERMGRTKAAVLSLLVDAYQGRNRVGLITFGKGGAHLVLPPTRSVRVAARLLEDVPVGGATPFAAGLAMSARVIASERRREPAIVPLLVVLTDGRGNLPLAVGGNPEVRSHGDCRKARPR